MRSHILRRTGLALSVVAAAVASAVLATASPATANATPNATPWNITLCSQGNYTADIDLVDANTVQFEFNTGNVKAHQCLTWHIQPLTRGSLYTAYIHGHWTSNDSRFDLGSAQFWTDRGLAVYTTGSTSSHNMTFQAYSS